MFIFLVLRIVYFNLAKGRELGHALLKLLNQVQSIEVFIPFRHLDSEREEIRKMKTTANLFLFLFFISFLGALIYGFVEYLN